MPSSSIIVAILLAINVSSIDAQVPILPSGSLALRDVLRCTRGNHCPSYPYDSKSECEIDCYGGEESSGQM